MVDHWAKAVAQQVSSPVPVAFDGLNDAERALRRKTHDTIRRITADIEERMHLNTAVSSLMELVNELYAFSETSAHGAPGRGDGPGPISERPQAVAVMREATEALLVTISPFTPHMAEELWELTGHRGGLAAATWPAFDADVARAAEVVVPVQVNGKVRSRFTAPADASEDTLREMALADATVQPYLAGKTVVKVLVAKGPLVSIVVKESR
jgi:leucyl-tRNA synthetase